MTHVSLFSGIGGMDIAAEWAGFRTILQVENADYPMRVLKKHWPNVPRIRDIREVTSETVFNALRERGLEPQKSRWEKGRRDRDPGEERIPITVVSGGFPCQPFSTAGKRRGADDDRYLWPEMLRVICCLEPAWVVAENVSGLLSLNDGMEFESVVASLEGAGYEIVPLHYPAAGVGAGHLRNRVFIVAHRTSADTDRLEDRRLHGGRQDETTQAITARHRTAVALSDSPGLSDRRQTGASASSAEENGRVALSEPERRGGAWWTVEPDVGRVAHGIPHRVDRLRALGNAVVPQQVYPVFAAIAETYKEKTRI